MQLKMVFDKQKINKEYFNKTDALDALHNVKIFEAAKMFEYLFNFKDSIFKIHFSKFWLTAFGYYFFCFN